MYITYTSCHASVSGWSQFSASCTLQLLNGSLLCDTAEILCNSPIVSLFQLTRNWLKIPTMLA